MYFEHILVSIRVDNFLPCIVFECRVEELAKVGYDYQSHEIHYDIKYFVGGENDHNVNDLYHNYLAGLHQASTVANGPIIEFPGMIQGVLHHLETLIKGVG